MTMVHQLWVTEEGYRVSEQAQLKCRNEWLTALQLAEIKDKILNVHGEGISNYTSCRFTSAL